MRMALFAISKQPVYENDGSTMTLINDLKIAFSRLFHAGIDKLRSMMAYNKEENSVL